MISSSCIVFCRVWSNRYYHKFYYFNFSLSTDTSLLSTLVCLLQSLCMFLYHFVTHVLAVLVIDASDASAKFGNNMFVHVLCTQFWSEKVYFCLYLFLLFKCIFHKVTTTDTQYHTMFYVSASFLYFACLIWSVMRFTICDVSCPILVVFVAWMCCIQKPSK